MSDAKVSGLGEPVKPVTVKGEMDVNDLAVALRRMDPDPASPPEPEPETAKSEKSEEAAAEAAAETPEAEVAEEKEDVLSQVESKKSEASEPASEPAEFEYPKFQKRVDALTAQKKEAQAKIAELEREMETMRSGRTEDSPELTPTAAVASDDPFGKVASWDDLKRTEASIENVLEWCNANPHGAVVKQADGTERDYTEDDIRFNKNRLEKALRKQMPERVEYLRARQHFDQQAADTYSWWKDKSSAEYQHAASLLRVFPELSKFPDYKLMVGDFLVGFKGRTGNKKAAAQAVVKKAPAQPVAPTSQPVPVEGTKARSDAARTRYYKGGGNVEDLAKLISSQDW